MSDEKDFKPGVYSIAAERYHAAAGVSKSMLDILAEQTPAHLQAYLKSPPPQTEAMRFGTIVHRALLEPDTFQDGFHVKPDKMSFATKDGKEWRDAHLDRPVITSPEALQIALMVSAVHTHPFAKKLLAGSLREQSVFVEDAQGLLRKSRLDALSKGNIIPDLKSVESAALDTFERSISRYRYHVQAAYYLDNCNLSGIEKQIWFFICIEKNPPYLVRCLQLSGDVIEHGRRLYQHDLQIYRNCLETGLWPGWGDQYEECSLPTWELRQLEMTCRGGRFYEKRATRTATVKGQNEQAVKAAVKLPEVPNFLLIDNSASISIADITDEGLRELAAAWGEELVKKAIQKRKERGR